MNMCKCIFSAIAALALLIGCQAESAAQAPAAATQPSVARDDARIRQYVKEMRDDLSRGKVYTINTVMQLNADESKKFWPIYQDYEQELFTLGDQRVELIKRYLRATAADKLDNKLAAELTSDWFKYQSQSLDLLRKYNQRITEELSAIRAAQFLQVENRIGTIIDLAIAADLPIVQTPSATPAAMKSSDQ